jgi:hypothetical protein
MSELTPEDIAVARAQGDVVALVLMASGLPVTAPKAKQQAPVQTSPLPPRSRPGAWPDGTRSPGPTPEVAEYLARLWPDRYAPATRS